MNVRLIKLSKEYYTQLSEMIDEWKLDHEVNQGNRSPWAIFKNDYHNFDYYLENLEINEPEDGKVPDSVYFLLDIERDILLGAVNIRHYLYLFYKKVVEKHLTLSRSDGGVDSAFSMEPEEFKQMVDNIRIVEKALGKVTYELSAKQIREREHSRSLFIAEDMKKGDVFTEANLRSVRPANGLHTKYYEELLGKSINRDVKLGTPMSWELLDFE